MCLLVRSASLLFAAFASKWCGVDPRADDGPAEEDDAEWETVWQDDGLAMDVDG